MKTDSQSANSVSQTYNRSVPSDANEVVVRIKEVCMAAITDKGKLLRRVVAKVSHKLKVDLEGKTGIDDTYVHSIESSAIIHNQKRHGNPKSEEKRGQIAIQMDDYLQIPDIIENYDSVEVSPNKNKQGNEVLLYTKKYADGLVFYLEEVRDNRKSLSFQTMYKKKNAGNSDGLMI